MLLKQTKTNVRAANQTDHKNLASLIHFETYVHRHLDYRPPLDYLGTEPFPIIDQGGEIVAALACPPDPPGVSWVRLFAASHDISPEKAWKTLWPVAKEQLIQYGNISWVSAIPIYSWFERLIRQSNFNQTQHIVLLRWENIGAPKEPTKDALATIRPMTLDDLDSVEVVDSSSFVPIWQNTQDYLEIAFRQASIATVAEIEGRLVGYQISTATPMGGHLARLAVSPDFQGIGVGSHLLFDLLMQFHRRGVSAVTVNTQHDNYASISLYRKLGFVPTGETYPIYQISLD